MIGCTESLAYGGESKSSRNVNKDTQKKQKTKNVWVKNDAVCCSENGNALCGKLGVLHVFISILGLRIYFVGRDSMRNIEQGQRV